MLSTSVPVSISPELYEDAPYFNYYRKLERKNQNIFGLSGPYNNMRAFQLDEFTLNATINDCVIESKYTLSYKNLSSTPVEGKYTLPLPSSSTVYEMRVEYDNKVLVGKIKEKTKAENTYSDAIASGGSAFMAEVNSEGNFVLSLGNIPAGKGVVIHLGIIGEITGLRDSLHFFLHKSYFPREGAFKLNVNLSVNVTAGIKEYTPVFHAPQSFEYDNPEHTKATVKYQVDKFTASNILFIAQPNKNDTPQPVIEINQADNTAAAAITLYPDFDGIDPLDIDQKSEFIFVLDCSGSMSGTPISKAKKALEIIVRSLNENILFNIYCFGSNFTKLFPKSVLYNDATLLEASNAIKKYDANLGGTELVSPISDILKQPYDSEYPRQIFIFTDGEVDDREGLINLVSKESYVRIFTYGIGNSVDKELILGLSKACKGFYEFITDVQEMEGKVMKLVNIAMEPMVSNVKIDWNGLSAIQTPSIVRPIFNHERLSLYGLIENADKLKDQVKTIKLTANGPKGDVISHEVRLDFSKSSTTTKSIHTLTSYSIIKDLCEDEKKTKEGAHKDRIVKLGKQYGIVSKHTSYVVTCDSDQVTQDTMKTVDLNNQKLEERELDCIMDQVQSMKLLSQNISYDLSQQSETLSSSPMVFKKQSRPLSSGGSGILNSITSFFSPSPSKSKTSQAVVPQAPPTLSSYQQSSPRRSRTVSAQPQCEMEEELDSCMSDSYSISSALPPPPPPSMSSGPLPPPPPSPSPSQSQSYSSSFSYSSDKNQQSQAQNDTVLSIISSQRANGSFDVGKLPFKPSFAPGSLAGLEDVWIALVVIARLEKLHASEKAKWSLTAQKALKFIRATLTKGGKIDSLPEFQTEASNSC